MPGSEIPDLQGVFRFVSRLHTMSKRGMRGALADCPRATSACWKTCTF